MDKVSDNPEKRAAPRPPRRRHLPSLGAFATFEVAAKHLSFTLAASELHVSQAAISQHIRALEKALNCQLFLRRRNGIELTAEGHTLLQAVNQGLDRLADGVFQIQQGGDSNVITISSTYAAISHYIKPLTDRFRREVPEVRFTLLASDENDRLQDFAEVDLSMICGSERSAVGQNLIPLFPEIVDPVCAPAFLKRHGPFEGPHDLLSVDLMELHRMHWSSDAISWYPLTWRDWFHQHSPDLEPPEPSFLTNSYGTLVDAAIAGDGVILGWRHLVRQAVEDGQLVRIMDRPLRANRSYYLHLKPTSRTNPHVRQFVAFIQDHAAQLLEAETAA